MDAFDVAIVGSGFGGSVTAWRTAEARRSVVVLERGRPYPPNSFARSPHGFAQNFWDPEHGRHGLFNIWSFEHMDAVVSAGLGGGSLIYANVLIRKDEHWFADRDGGVSRPWLITRADLEPHYDEAERMLDAQTFPMAAPPYDDVRKAAEFKAAAISLGFEETTHDRVDPSRRQWYLPLLAVSFKSPGRPPVPGEHLEEDIRNLHDRDRQTCRLCGECDVGCNYGAKNTLDYTYLTRAAAAGAVIRTLAEVTRFRRADDGDGFIVEYSDHSVTGNPQPPAIEIRARRLVLAAGTFGSTRLLLRHADQLPLSPMLGHRFSGNGDGLTFAIAAVRGDDDVERPLDPSHGPVITSTLRSPDAADGLQGGIGYYLQDAGYPAFVEWLAQAADVRNDVKGVGRLIIHRLAAHLLHRADSNLDPDLAAVFAGTSLSAGSMPLLGMGLDTPDGVLRLDGAGQLVLDWTQRASQPFYDQVGEVSKGIAEAMDAHFIPDPLAKLFGRHITVHPLGGCSMGRTAAEGVVDEWGRVHGVPGLHVADGSVMPGPVGPNPSLTIAALADRFALRMLDDMSTGP